MEISCLVRNMKLTVDCDKDNSQAEKKKCRMIIYIVVSKLQCEDNIEVGERSWRASEYRKSGSRGPKQEPRMCLIGSWY